MIYLANRCPLSSISCRGVYGDAEHVSNSVLLVLGAKFAIANLHPKCHFWYPQNGRLSLRNLYALFNIFIVGVGCFLSIMMPRLGGWFSLILALNDVGDDMEYIMSHFPQYVFSEQKVKVKNNNVFFTRKYGTCIDLREAPFKMSSPLFGHCPNSDCPPPPRPALKRALWGTFFPGRFEQICQITILMVHKCTKHPGKP